MSTTTTYCCLVSWRCNIRCCHSCYYPAAISNATFRRQRKKINREKGGGVKEEESGGRGWQNIIKTYGCEKFQYTQRCKDPFATVPKLKLRVTGSSCSICEGVNWLLPIPTWADTTSVTAAVVNVPSSIHVVAGTVVALVRKTPMGTSRNSRKNTGRGAMRIRKKNSTFLLF